MHVKGRVARQAHVDVPEGLCEEEYARSGFFGRTAHLYRTEPPVSWSRIEGPLKPRAYDLAKTTSDGQLTGDFAASRQPVLVNDDVALCLVKLNAPMPYYFRNADGDDVLFVHSGAGVLETDFGPLSFRKGDYLVIPRGTVYRLAPNGPSEFLVVESRDEIRIPDRGMLGRHALFDPAMLNVPTPDPEARHGLAPNAAGEFELRIKRLGELTRVFYPKSPISAVGWKGDLSVWQLNVADIRPVLSERYHLPPSAHTTFLADSFVICTFLPRGLETGDPGAMKVPFFHANIDFDEVLFYHSGNFFSRTGISSGMLTFHPQGIHHGPQPGAVERTREATRTDEIAVMIDTRRPLVPGPAAARLELEDYWRSWGAK